MLQTIKLADEDVNIPPDFLFLHVSMAALRKGLVL